MSYFSQNNSKTVTACEIEKKRASGTRKETREQGAGKESESSRVRLLVTQNRDAATCP